MVLDLQRDLSRSVAEAVAAMPRAPQGSPQGLPQGTVQGVATSELVRQSPPSAQYASPRYQAPAQPSPFEHAVREECFAVGNLLVAKNAQYGDSALHPLRIFSDAHPIEQILVRIDDKLSRIRNHYWDQGEDTIQDLIGYLVLLQIARKGGVPA